MKFEEQYDCERCQREALICKTGVCEKCYKEMQEIKAGAIFGSVETRLGQLAQSENGIRMSIRRETARDTHQADSRQKLTLGKLANSLQGNTQAHELIRADPAELSKKRNVKGLTISLEEISKELIKFLAKNPDEMRSLRPRKFEEFVQELLIDQGHTVELTKESRDGGLDIYVGLKTQFGTLLAIVECKKWAANRPIPLDVIERFLYTVREKEKANLGLIMATTRFTADAKKEAGNFKNLLKLRDFQALQEMASQYGSWSESRETGVWMPNATDT